MIKAILLGALLASNATGKTVVRTHPGTLVSAAGGNSLILSLPSETLHAYWRGTLVDRSGTAWTQNGTVPQVARSGLTPPGAGIYSASNFYATAATTDPMDTAGDFSGCVLVNLPDVTTVQQVLVDGIATGNGWSVYVAATAAYFVTYDSGVANSTSASIATGLNLICFGRSGTTQILKVNLAAVESNGSAKQAADTTNAARIGLYTSGAAPLLGYVHELVFGPAPASDTLFTSVATRAKAKLGTAW